MDLFTKSSQYFQELQSQICSCLEEFESTARFSKDSWIKEKETNFDNGGGLTRVIQNGEVFEKGGVNFSSVQGLLKPQFAKQLTGKESEQVVNATGISLVIHPRSPMVPTTHANLRFLKVGELTWFGGGMDLTPYYLYEDDAMHFHKVIKNCCDRHSADYYPQFKIECDQYFYLPHREETRGVGGVFFDYLGRNGNEDMNAIFEFVKDLGNHWCEMYAPIVAQRKSEPYGDKERNFQLIRRGRYVEFNLLYDRGTKFGLETKGRIESILMSLPNIVHWEYEFQPENGSREAKLIEVLKQPRSWV